MLGKRIIPCLDVQDGRVVKGINFVNIRDAGDPVELARVYDQEGADELVFLDIAASVEGRRTMVELVREVAANVFIPFTVGGGINSVEEIKELLRAGADKVSINTAAVLNPELIGEAASVFGRQCVVVAVDVRWSEEAQSYEVATHGGTKRTGLDAIEWVKEVENLGAGEILLTSMDRDGTKDGYDLEVTQAVAKAVNIPVIASGGAGNAGDVVEVLTKGGADAALAASIFHYGEARIGDIKQTLQSRGIPVRRGERNE